ncbi:MAG: HEAT repeat domain-containing protein [Thermoleophilia bacterium]
MTTKTDEYRAQLRFLDEWDAFLLKESGLPGPRGNIELAQVVVDEGTPELFHRYLTFAAAEAPTKSPYEFLAFCGVVGLGRLLAEGDVAILPILRRCASDPRWRLREAVAMALQRLGDADMDLLIHEMLDWSSGSLLEQRAAAAALCEPRLLGRPEHARETLHILNRITASLKAALDRRTEDFRALRKGLGYCWSVAAASLPDEGKSLMEEWFSEPDADVRWVMRENLKKNRLVRMDAAWVEEWRAATVGGGQESRAQGRPGGDT